MINNLPRLFHFGRKVVAKGGLQRVEQGLADGWPVLGLGSHVNVTAAELLEVLLQRLQVRTQKLNGLVNRHHESDTMVYKLGVLIHLGVIPVGILRVAKLDAKGGLNFEHSALNNETDKEMVSRLIDR